MSDQWKAGHQQHNAERTQRIAGAVRCLQFVASIMPLGRVIDFGCGIGAWLHAADLLGATSAIGIEGEWIAAAETLVDKSRIRIADLATAPPTFAKDFDLALSIEVAEHLPEASADRFVASIVSAADHVVFSAAIPGQGGLGHVNEQPLPYWVEKFWARRYVPLEPIRPYVVDDPAVVWWLRQNIVMFVRYDALIREPERWLRFARPLGDFRLLYRQ